jgi:hypothetical protein|nr:hypothetical protein [bacterium]
MRRKKQELFRHHVAEQHPSEIKEKARTLITKFLMLHETLSSIDDHNGKEYLKYFSELFQEAKPLVTELTTYVVVQGYSGRVRKFDNSVFRMQEILGNLKLLHLSYLSLVTIPRESDYLFSQKGNKEILNDLKMLLEAR